MPNYFGECLAKIRRKRRLRQRQLAKDAGLDASYIAALENGRRLPPRDAILEKVAVAIGATPNEIAELKRTAWLTKASIALQRNAPGPAMATQVVLVFLELSPVMSEPELEALRTIIEGYRYRSYVQGGATM